MARFNLPGDLGNFVRTVPFEERKRKYSQFGLGNVLGSFVGDPRQNQALFNKMQKENNVAPPLQVAGGNLQTAASSLQFQTPAAPAALPKATDVRNLAISGGAFLLPTNAPPATPAPRIAPAPIPQVIKEAITPRPPAPPAGTEPKTDLASVQGSAVEEATGGFVSAADVSAAAENSPDVIFEKERIRRLQQRNQENLDRALTAFASRAALDIEDLKFKASDVKARLLADLERRGLAAGGIKETGEARVAAGLETGIERRRKKLTAEELEAEARTLAANENLDIGLSRTILKAVNAELRAQEKARETEQKAIDDFLKSQGLIINPFTGQLLEIKEKETPVAAQKEYEFAVSQGYKGSFLDYQRFKATQYGTEIPAGEKPATQQQFLVAGYAQRIEQANNIFAEIEKTLQAMSPVELALQMKLPGPLKNATVRQYDQASRNFINAVLRRESGAAIAPSEFESAAKQYFVQPGDDPGTMLQKQLNRSLVLQSFKNEAGSAFVPTSLTAFPGVVTPGTAPVNGGGQPLNWDDEDFRDYAKKRAKEGAGLADVLAEIQADPLVANKARGQTVINDFRGVFTR